MNSSLLDLRVKEFFEKMAQNPPPGGGSAAALAGLMGVSLLEMAAAVSEKHSAGERLAGARNELAGLHRELSSLIDRDAKVLAEVLPLLSGAGIADGSGSTETGNAVQRAISVPMAIARNCIRGLEAARLLLPDAAGHVLGDLLLGVFLCHNAVTGALLMTAVNLPFMADTKVQEDCKAQMKLLEHAAKALANELKETVYAQEPYRCMK